MQNWWQIAHEAKDILTVCLAKGIDQALAAQFGSNWFADFAQADAKEKVNIRITKPNQQSVRDWDLQALLKFLRYRSNLTGQVLAHYGFFTGLDSFSADSQMQQLNDLLDRLINDFRNRIEAHPRAADIEKELAGNGVNRIYGYEEAYQDMYRLARVFSAVTDSKGISYARRMAALTKKKSKKPIFFSLGGVAALALVIGLVVWLLPGKTVNDYRDQRPPVVQQNEISLQPIHVYYKGNDLVAVCYVINGTQQLVSDIDIYSLRLTAGSREIAAANFGILENLTLEPGASGQWQFRFPAETVSAHNADLTDLQLHFLCRHS